jgi:hypothetical protein
MQTRSDDLIRSDVIFELKWDPNEWREVKGGLGRFIAPPKWARIQLSVSTLTIHTSAGV